MHRNIARAYDCLQDEHGRIRAACVTIHSQGDKRLERELLRATSTVHDIMTRCFSARSAYLDPNGLALVI